MSKLKFDSSGRFIGVNDGLFDKYNESKSSHSRKFDNSQDTEYWSLYKDSKRLPPLKFSNGKTQEDVVKEVVDLVKAGTKIIFLHGVCGTGKSAIALNIARVLGKAAVVVPVKNLQRQYEEDYMGKMFLLKSSGEKLRISTITGRGNHDSVFEPGVFCDDPFLPDTIQINEQNFKKLREYYERNPFIENKSIVNMNQLKMYMEDLRKKLIVDEKEYEKERIPELVNKILKYGKVTTEGKIMLEKNDFAIRDNLKLMLIFRFLANKLNKTISEEITIDELLISMGSNNKASISTRMKEVVDSGIAKRTSKGKFVIIPFFIEPVLDKLDKKMKNG